MGRGWLIALSMMAGCFDFDLLKRPFDDLGAADDLAGVDLAGADFADVDFAGSDLGVTGDLAGADLVSCVAPPSFTGRVFYVAPGGGGDGSTPAAAAGSINNAVQKATMAPDPAVVLIAAGTYVETVSINTTGILGLYGGFNPTFTCRDPSPGNTKLVGRPSGVGLVISNGFLTLDGMTIAGGGASATDDTVGIAIDGSSGTVSGTVHDCEVRSHDSLSTQVHTAYAMSVQAATVTIDQSHLIAGATAGTASPGAWGLFLCTAAATVVDSQIETDDPGSAHAQIAVDFPSTACGTPALTPALSVTRSSLFAHGAGASNTAFRLGRTGITPRFESSALIAPAGNVAVGNNSAGSPLAMTFVGSTLNGTGAGSRAINLASTSTLSLGLTDSILIANIPISSSGAIGSIQLTHSGVNLLHGVTTTIVALSTGSLDIAGYQTNYDSSGLDMDPLLSTTDYIHLQAGSPAVGLAGASPCSTPKDIDGESRPKGTNCDVGADEQ
jgi:hypothetical protein